MRHYLLYIRDEDLKPIPCFRNHVGIARETSSGSLIFDVGRYSKNEFDNPDDALAYSIRDRGFDSTTDTLCLVLASYEDIDVLAVSVPCSYHFSYK